MEQHYFKTVFEFPVDEFKKHLENTANEKIIFSGKYGIGKTTFLKQFFDLEYNKHKYDVYRLFPINYSISQNEDILQFIKYDILIELLLRKASIEEFELDFAQTLPIYIQQNAFKVISSVLFMTPKIGKDLDEFINNFDKLKDKFMEFHKKSNTSDSDVILNYLEKLETQEGSIYENNLVTKLISGTIEKSKPKESILVVDDIDRLDPEHVFRILNVFAAHFDSPDYSGKKNKFNFDKIIIVCDFNNIRNLFHHRYGSEVDFIGYIDKFYSSDIYNFDNKAAILGVIDEIFDLTTYSLTPEESKDYVSQLYFKDCFVKNICKILLVRNIISLRSLLKISKKEIAYHYEKLVAKKYHEKYAHLVPIAMQIKLVKDILGDYDNMHKAFTKCFINEGGIEDFELFFGLLMYVLTIDFHTFSRTDRMPDIDFTFMEKRMLIAVNLGFSNERLNSVNVYEYNERNGNQDRGMQLSITSDMFWQAMLDAIKKLKQLGFLS